MDKKISVIFYQTPSGNEPVREWLKSLSVEDRQNIGNDIKTVEYGWPIGMPVVINFMKYEVVFQTSGLHE